MLDQSEYIKKLEDRIIRLEKLVMELELDRIEMPSSSNPRGWRRSVNGIKHTIRMKISELNYTCNLPSNFDEEKFFKELSLTEDSDPNIVLEEYILKNV